MEVGLAVGGAFMSSALNVFFDRMTPKFPHLFHGRKDGDQLLRKLKTTLLLNEMVLNDAENKSSTDILVKKWLRELKHTVYRAEDLIDEINTEALRLAIKESELSVTNSVSHLSAEFLNDIIPKIELIVSELECCSTEAKIRGLGGEVTKKDNSERQSTSLVDESGVFGRDNESEDLIRMVLSDDANGNNISVIPIVGMGGLGKTTLAQLVYNDERVKKHFDKREWVCVGENYDASQVTKLLVDGQLGSEEKEDLNRLQVKLKESLAVKKFLIVLDDVWNENYTDWDQLMLPMKYGKQGSKLILTTRIEKIAFMVQSYLPIHHLNPISDEDCWLLFKNHAFGGGGRVASPEFEKIGKEIVKKCKGLPLAVKALGGLLRSETEVYQWNDILKSQFWKLENDVVLPVLRLSYHHLPPHLKHCFAFCAIFPNNYRFDAKELVRLWMANDLVHHPSRMDKTIEDVGHEYINELRSRSLFQKVSGGGYVMHDLVNDLAQYVSGNFCVRYEDCYQHGEIPSEARHFSCLFTSYNTFEIFKFLGQIKTLRTFFPMYGGTKISSLDILLELRCLRVLSLYKSNIQELPNSVCNLKHLRYIDLSWTPIEQLPDAICSMHNLQTLKLAWCRYLHELPMNFSDLVNLRHLELTGTGLKEMPSHMGRLKSLQTLSYFIVGKSPGRGIEELEKLNLHGSLEIKGLENIMSCNDAVKANLKNKNHLEDLILEWKGDTDDSQIDRDILDKLQPNTSLKRVTIDGYGGTIFPDWFSNECYCNIVSISLKNCRNCVSLPALGHLPSLESIYIERLDSISEVGQEFYGDASFTKPFQSLVHLWFEEMYELKMFDLQVGFLSSLEILKFSNMPNLKELPERIFGLGGLQELLVQGCDNLVSFPMIQDQNEFPKGLRKISILGCDNLLCFPNGGLPAPNLVDFRIHNCMKLKSLPEKMHSLNPSLQYMSVIGSPEIESLPEGGLPISLENLSIGRCEKLTRCKRSWDIRNFLALEQLALGDNNQEFCMDEWLLPSSLKYLSILCCGKLEALNEKAFLGLTSLQALSIHNCPELLSLPLIGLPATLSTLDVRNCPLLKPHLQRETGNYWSTISYIPSIHVDGVII